MKDQTKGKIMQLYRVNGNGNEYEFVCEFKNTRNGFKHECTLFINDRREMFATCNYINRTWESYNYQTVMLRAVSMLLEERIDLLKCAFKEDNGYEKMTKKRNEEFQKIVDDDEFVMEYIAVKKLLDKRP